MPSIVSAAQSSCGSMKPDLSTSNESKAVLRKSTSSNRYLLAPSRPTAQPAAELIPWVRTDIF